MSHQLQSVISLIFHLIRSTNLKKKKWKSENVEVGKCVFSSVATKRTLILQILWLESFSSKKSIGVCVLIGVCCAQIYIPSGLSTNSGIVRNVPTTFIRIPASTYLTDGNRAYLAAPIPFQFITTRFSEDTTADRKNKFTADKDDKVQDLRKFTTDKDDRTKAQLRDDKDEKLVKDLTTLTTAQREDLLKTTVERNEKLRDLLKLRTDNKDDGTYRTTGTFDKDQLRAFTTLTTGNDADTYNRFQGVNDFDRFTTAFNRFRDVNEFDRSYGRY